MTIAASILLLVTGALSAGAVGGGVIPLRFHDAAGAYDFPVPAMLTPLTATLMHGGTLHLALNMVMLIYCGLAVERAVGVAGMMLLYVVGAFAAAAGHFAFGPQSPIPMIGASGAISAIVAGYALLYGENRARTIGPVPAGVVHVVWLAAAWIGIQLLVGFAGLGTGAPIAIGAHIGGFIAGLIMTRPLLRWRYRSA